MVDRVESAPRLALRPKDAAAALGISERTLARLKAAGKLQFARIGTAILYPVDGLSAFLAGKSFGEASE